MNARTRDQISIAKRFTPLRLFNALLVFASYHFSKWLKRPFHWGSPVSISIEPTTSCNLGCPECPSGLKKFTRATGNTDPVMVGSVFKQLKRSLTYVTFYFQGEPFLHPKFLELVRLAKSFNLYTATSTNAHFLRDQVARATVESGLDRLIISIDGTTQETYEQYRIGGKLDKVIEGTRNLVKWKRELKSSTPHVIFQYLVVKPNEHQIDDVMKLGEELGVDEVRFKTAQLYDYENGNELMPGIDKYSRYRKNNQGKYEIKNPLNDHCWRMWQGCVVTWDGKVVPCCFDKDAKHQLGDLSNSTFNELWNSEKYRSFRASVLKSRKSIDICTNCTEGTKVWEEA